MILKELFRRIYGDELADQVEQLAAKRTGVEWRKREPRLDRDGRKLPETEPDRAREGDR